MVIQQKNGPVPSFCACPGMCGHGELSRGGGKCGRGAEGLQRRSVSRGGKGRLVTVIHRGHCCSGTAVVALEEPGGI